MKKLQPRKIYRYTGPDFQHIKTGSAFSIRGWSEVLDIRYPTLYARLTRKSPTHLIQDLPQDLFNCIINPHLPIPKERSEILVQMEVDLAYLKHKQIIRDLVIQKDKAGTPRYIIALDLGISSIMVKQILGIAQATDLTDESLITHKCKCPTCGEIYYRKGFYTGRGLWRKRHDPGTCSAESTILYGQRYRLGADLKTFLPDYI